MDQLRNSEEHQGVYSSLLPNRPPLISCSKPSACTAYSRYILDIGASEDWLALQIAMFPCLLGYHHIAKRLSLLQDPTVPRNANRYSQWIDNYIADDYTQAVGKGTGKLSSNQTSRETVLTSLQNWLRAMYSSNLRQELKNWSRSSFTQLR